MTNFTVRSTAEGTTTVPVTDEQVATLRAQLAGDTAEHQRLLAQLDRAADAKGYTVLVSAAFFEAVDRRFAGKATASDVVEYVGDIRATSPRIAEDVDPSAAERLIKFSLGADVRVDDIDPNTRLGVQIVILGALINDEQMDDSELDAFLTEVRSSADEMLS